LVLGVRLPPSAIMLDRQAVETRMLAGVRNLLLPMQVARAGSTPEEAVWRPTFQRHATCGLLQLRLAVSQQAVNEWDRLLATGTILLPAPFAALVSASWTDAARHSVRICGVPPSVPLEAWPQMLALAGMQHVRCQADMLAGLPRADALLASFSLATPTTPAQGTVPRALPRFLSLTLESGSTLCEVHNLGVAVAVPMVGAAQLAPLARSAPPPATWAAAAASPPSDASQPPAISSGTRVARPRAAVTVPASSVPSGPAASGPIAKPSVAPSAAPCPPQPSSPAAPAAPPQAPPSQPLPSPPAAPITPGVLGPWGALARVPPPSHGPAPAPAPAPAPTLTPLQPAQEPAPPTASSVVDDAAPAILPRPTTRSASAPTPEQPPAQPSPLELPPATVAAPGAQPARELPTPAASAPTLELLPARTSPPPMITCGGAAAEDGWQPGKATRIAARRALRRASRDVTSSRQLQVLGPKLHKRGGPGGAGARNPKKSRSARLVAASDHPLPASQ
jgi:hypothetical protein